MDIQNLANSLNLPAVSAFMLGVMASLGPCTLATNLAAMAYISRRISERRFAVTGGALYILGRMITYSALGILIIYAGISIPVISNFLQDISEVVVGPLLIIVGLIMLFIDRISFGEHGSGMANAVGKLADAGMLGALPLGIVLALAFCPYSAVLFFMVLIPLTLKTHGGGGIAGFIRPGHRVAGPSVRHTSFAGCGRRGEVDKCYQQGGGLCQDRHGRALHHHRDLLYAYLAWGILI